MWIGNSINAVWQGQQLKSALISALSTQNGEMTSDTRQTDQLMDQPTDRPVDSHVGKLEWIISKAKNSRLPQGKEVRIQNEIRPIVY